MVSATASCPMTLGEILDEYYLENRHKLLEIAAFLDRLERARDGAAPGQEFRVEALRRAICVLLEPHGGSGAGRAREIQMILSDPTEEPRARLDRKAAWGAFRPTGEGE